MGKIDRKDKESVRYLEQYEKKNQINVLMWQRKRNRVNWLQGKENYFEKMLANDNKVGGGSNK